MNAPSASCGELAPKRLNKIAFKEENVYCKVKIWKVIDLAWDVTYKVLQQPTFCLCKNRRKVIYLDEI